MTDDLGALSRLFETNGSGTRFFGVVIGVVTNNKDPDKLGRVKVKFPWLSDTDESYWARVMTPMAGNQRGLYLLPEVDDEVLVGFEHGRVEYPYVLGALWNGKDKPPETNDDGKNNKRTLKSRSGMILRFDDTQGKEKIEITSVDGKALITIDSAESTITISADADITIESKKGKVVIKGKGIELASTAEVKVEANSSMDLKASGQMTIKGATVNIN
jgi:uncharacterized protein involved in type VI secretion and phage assembly